ncbi:hypothetical protein FOZ63_013813, partial [Perkinsus olseni]
MPEEVALEWGASPEGIAMTSNSVSNELLEDDPACEADVGSDSHELFLSYCLVSEHHGRITFARWLLCIAYQLLSCEASRHFQFNMMERPDASTDVVEDRVKDNNKFVVGGTPSNVATLLMDRPELLIEMGTFLTPADLHKLARTSSSLYTLLSSRLSPCTDARRCLTRTGSLLSEAIRRYGIDGICTAQGLPLLPSDVEGMLKALMVLVQQSILPPEVFYVALLLHRDAVLQLWECQSGCTLPHLFARHGGWRQIYIFAIFGGDVDAPLGGCGGQPGPIADPDHHTPPIVSVPTSLVPVPLSLLGPTPLLHALRYLNLREAEALVEAGADVTIADEEGRVPLSVAMRYSISSPRLLIGLADPKVLLIKDRSG